MTVTVLPDVTAIAVAALLDSTDVDAYLDGRVYRELPDRPSFPCARVTLVDTVPVMRRPRWAAQVLVQVDVWGGPTQTTLDAAETVAAVLADDSLRGTVTLAAPNGDDLTGVVSQVDVTGPRLLPDPSYSPAKPRCVVDATFTIHP